MLPLLSACLSQYHIVKPYFLIPRNILYPKEEKLYIYIYIYIDNNQRHPSLAYNAIKIIATRNINHTLSLITDPRTSDQIRPRKARGDPLLRNSCAIGA